MERILRGGRPSKPPWVTQKVNRGERDTTMSSQEPLLVLEKLLT